MIQSSVAGGIDPGLTAAFNAGSTLYPEQVGDPSVSHRSHAMWFNPAAFANPADGTFGNAHRNTLIGPGFANVNLSIAKEFPLHEAIALEVRADMFDVFNHINWSNPDFNVGYSTTRLNSPARVGFHRTAIIPRWPSPFRDRRTHHTTRRSH